MKTIKRVIAITLLIVVGFLVGCLFYTNNRLKTYPSEISVLQGDKFTGKEDTTVEFNGENRLVYIVGERAWVLQVTEYKDGVIYANASGQEYRFVVVDDMLYDMQTEEFLYKGATT